jgi:hypothetical protein
MGEMIFEEQIGVIDTPIDQITGRFSTTRRTENPTRLDRVNARN